MAPREKGLIPALEVRFRKTEDHFIEATIHICMAKRRDGGFKRKTGSTFLSNPEIRRAIKESGLTEGEIGRLNLVYAGVLGRAIWTSYLPFYQSKVGTIFNERGIERLLEIKVRDRAERQFKGLKSFEHRQLREPRRKQLIKRGHPRGDYYTLAKDKELLPRQIGFGTQKARQKKSGKVPRKRPK